MLRLSILLLLLLFAACREDKTDHLLSGAEEAQELTPEDSLFMRTAFKKAEQFMDRDYYDSAQIWLNRIHEKVSYRNPSLFSYYLTSRQAEVYYYNNLAQLGLQESQRALTIATALNNNYLKADALNFCGLFLANMDRTREAISYYREGIVVYPKAVQTERYLELSRPHHLYGNMSEAYGELGQLDTAIFYSAESLGAAKTADSPRGIANALLNTGVLLLKKGYADSAAVYFRQTRQVASKSRDFDIELNSIGSLAECLAMKQNKDAALQTLQSGFALMRSYTQLNSFYALFFLESAAKVYRQYEAFESLSQALAMQSDIQTATQLRNNRQYETIMMTGLKNETRILNLEVTKARHEQSLANTRLYLLISVFILLMAGFLAYRYFARQKLKLAVVRNKISQDLHDEIGSTLSGIAMYSYITREQSNSRQIEDVEKSLAIIEKNAIDMVKKLNDIVWVVNPDYDSFESLLLRLEEYAVETGAAKAIVISMNRVGTTQKVKLSMDERKNCYLICKEAVNNAIKYSGCSAITITANAGDNLLVMQISDNGSGFDGTSHQKGNGIPNMIARAKEMNARFEINNNKDGGTNVTLTCKITH